MADACKRCLIPRADTIAFVKWPASLDPERCESCGAVVSYRWPLESITGKQGALFERRRIPK
jgi:hypothetical protein